MPVTVTLPSVLAPLTGGKSTHEVAGATVGDAVAAIAKRFPEVAPRLRDARGEPYAYVVYYVNDDDIRFQQGFATPLADGDEIVVVPAIAGG
jgi:sulfur-carrier protein